MYVDNFEEIYFAESLDFVLQSLLETHYHFGPFFWVRFFQCSSEGQICPPAEAGASVAKKPGDSAGDEAPAEDRRSNRRPKFYRRS